MTSSSTATIVGANQHNIATRDLINPNNPNNHGFNMQERVSSVQDPKYWAEGMTIIEPMKLFNIMMKVNSDRYPAVSDANYLLLLDARRRETYDQSHIVLAKFSTRTAGQYELPYDSQVETKKNIVVYDDMTEILRFDNGRSIKTDATRLAKVLYTEGARCAISILRGGFILFSKLYPFLRTSSIIQLPKELDIFFCYPRAIITHKLYLGSLAQISNKKIVQDLKLTAFVNCSEESREITLSSPQDGSKSHNHSSLLRRRTNQRQFSQEAINLQLPKCSESCELTSEDVDRLIPFINDNAGVLVYDNSGMKRAVTVCIAYMMYKMKAPILAILKYFNECDVSVIPSELGIEDLSSMESSYPPFQKTEYKS